MLAATLFFFRCALWGTPYMNSGAYKRCLWALGGYSFAPLSCTISFSKARHLWPHSLSRQRWLMIRVLSSKTSDDLWIERTVPHLGHLTPTPHPSRTLPEGGGDVLHGVSRMFGGRSGAGWRSSHSIKPTSLQPLSVRARLKRDCSRALHTGHNLRRAPSRRGGTRFPHSQGHTSLTPRVWM